MKFDERLTELRKAKGLSQKDCASELGMPDASKYNKWENGANRPDYETVCQLATYFDVTTDFLLGASDCKKLENDNIAKETGLSENAVKMLRFIGRMKSNNHSYTSNFLNTLLTDEMFLSLAHDVEKLNLLNERPKRVERLKKAIGLMLDRDEEYTKCEKTVDDLFGEGNALIISGEDVNIYLENGIKEKILKIIKQHKVTDLIDVDL